MQTEKEKVAAIETIVANSAREDAMPDDAPRVNAYVCDKCGTVAYCVDVSEGTTPMVIPCLSSDGSKIVLLGGGKAHSCSGNMKSAWYSVRPGDVDLVSIPYEWRAATIEKYKQFKKTRPALADHIMNGGLMLHKRTNSNGPILTHGGFYIRPDGSRLTEDEEDSMMSGIERLKVFLKLELTMMKREAKERDNHRAAKVKKRREANKRARSARRRS